MLGQMLQPMRLARPTQPITVSADPASNTIIVATPAPVMHEIEKMIECPGHRAALQDGEMVILPLKNADAPALAAVLSDILTPGTDQAPDARGTGAAGADPPAEADQGQGGPASAGPVQADQDHIRPAAGRRQEGSNSLIVSSTPENLAAMAEIVALLDNVPIAQGVKLQLVHLKNSDANTVMALLKEVFAQGRSLAGKPGTPLAGKAEPESVIGKALTDALSITADTRTNTLVLAGTDEALALAADRQGPGPPGHQPVHRGAAVQAEQRRRQQDRHAAEGRLRRKRWPPGAAAGAAAAGCPDVRQSGRLLARFVSRSGGDGQAG